MAALDSIRSQISIANGEKVFVLGPAGLPFAFTGASASFDLGTFADADGVMVCRIAPAGTFGGVAPGGQSDQSMLMLQGTQDFWYTFTNAAGTAVVGAAVHVLANQQEYVQPRAGRRFLNIISNGTSGNCSLFVLKAS